MTQELDIIENKSINGATSRHVYRMLREFVDFANVFN